MRRMTKQELRENLLVMMHEYVRMEIADEDAYMKWITIVPDEPIKEDFEFIAENDEEWQICARMFGKLVRCYE